MVKGCACVGLGNAALACLPSPDPALLPLELPVCPKVWLPMAPCSARTCLKDVVAAGDVVAGQAQVLPDLHLCRIDAAQVGRGGELLHAGAQLLCKVEQDVSFLHSVLGAHAILCRRAGGSRRVAGGM